MPFTPPALDTEVQPTGGFTPPALNTIQPNSFAPPTTDSGVSPSGSIWGDLVGAYHDVSESPFGDMIRSGVDALNDQFNKVNQQSTQDAQATLQGQQGLVNPETVQHQEQTMEGLGKAMVGGALSTIPAVAGVVGAAIVGTQHPLEMLKNPSQFYRGILNVGENVGHTVSGMMSLLTNQFQPSNPDEAAAQTKLGEVFNAPVEATVQTLKNHGASQLVQDYAKYGVEGLEYVLGGEVGKVAGKVGGVFKKAFSKDTGIGVPDETLPTSNNIEASTGASDPFVQYLKDNDITLTGNPTADYRVIEQYENSANQPAVETITPKVSHNLETGQPEGIAPEHVEQVRQIIVKTSPSIPSHIATDILTNKGGDPYDSVYFKSGPDGVANMAHRIESSRTVQDLSKRQMAGEDVEAPLHAAVQRVVTNALKKDKGKPLFKTKTIELKTAGDENALEHLIKGGINLDALNDNARHSLSESVRNRDTEKMLRVKPELEQTVLKDEYGNLLPVYHGTQSSELFEAHDPHAGGNQGFTSFTFDPGFAQIATNWQSREADLGKSATELIPRIQRGFLNVKKVWDYANPADVNALLHDDAYLEHSIKRQAGWTSNNEPYLMTAKRIANQEGVPLVSALRRTPLNAMLMHLENRLHGGSWGIIEDGARFLYAKGYDAFTTQEEGAHNIHVFDPQENFVPESVFFRSARPQYGIEKAGTERKNPFLPGVQFLMTAGIKDPLKKALLAAAYEAQGIKELPLYVKEAKERGFSAAKFTDYETRPGTEVRDSLFTTNDAGHKVPVEEDIGEARSNSIFSHIAAAARKGAHNFKQGSYLGDSGTVVRKVVDAADLMDKTRRQLTEDVIHGIKFADKGIQSFGLTSLRSASRVDAPGSMFYHANRMSEENLRQLIDFMNSNNGIKDYSAAEMQALGFKPSQMEAYKEIRNGLDKTLKYYNKVAESLGHKPIERKPGFLPAMWFGDWRTWVSDPTTGERYKVYGSDTWFHAQGLAKGLRGEFPQYKVEVEPSRAGHYDITAPTEAFAAAKELFGLGTPERAAIDIAANKIMQKQGFRAHGLRRRGIQGAAGTYEEGKTLFGRRDKRVKNMMQALQTYVEQSFRYTTARQYQHDILPMMLDADVQKAYKNQWNIANAYLRTYLGEDSWINGPVSQFAVKYLGLSSNLLIQQKLLFYNTGFLISNLFQSAHIIPRLSMLQNMGFKDASVGYALLKGSKDTFLAGPELKEFLRQAQADGILDARFVESFSWLTGKRGGAAKAAWNVLSGTWIANKVDSFSRLSALVTYARFFESAGIERSKALRMAKKETDRTMVAYERFKRIPALNHLGVFGEAMAPLTSFMTNDLNALALYSIEAAKGVKGASPKAFLPLLYKTGVYMSLAGIIGLPFMKDIDKLVSGLNILFKQNIPTPIAYLMSSGYSDVLIFGIPSVMTNMDITGVAGGPSILQFGSMAGLENAWSILKKVAPVVADYFNEAIGTGSGPTRSELSAAGQSLLPKTIASAIQQAQNPKGMVGTTYEHGGVDYRQGPQDITPFGLPAGQLGSKSIPQSKFQIGMEAMRESQNNMKRIQSSALENFIDKVVDGSLASSDINSFVTNYAKRGGGNLANLDTVLENQLRKRMMDRVQRMVMSATAGSKQGVMNLQQMKKLQLLSDQINQMDPVEIGKLGKALSSEH